jgi:hypothetical protein
MPDEINVYNENNSKPAVITPAILGIFLNAILAGFTVGDAFTRNFLVPD